MDCFLSSTVAFNPVNFIQNYDYPTFILWNMKWNGFNPHRTHPYPVQHLCLWLCASINAFWENVSLMSASQLIFIANKLHSLDKVEHLLKMF